MRRGVMLGAGALVLAVGFFGLRTVVRQKAGLALDQGIDELLSQLPPGYAVRHGVTDVNPLTSAVTVHDVVLSRNGAPVMLADTLTVAGADQRALQDVFDPGAYPQGHPAWTDRRLLVADATAGNVRLPRLTPQDGLVTVRSVTFHRLSGRPFAMPPTPQNRRTAIFAADAALAFTLDSAAVHDLSFSDTSPEPSAGSLRTITLSDYDAGKLGSATLRGLAVHAPAKAGGRPIDITLDHMDVRHVDARAMLETVQRSGTADSLALGKVAYGSVEAGGFTMRIPAGPDISAADIRSEQSLPAEDGGRPGRAWLHGLTLSLGQTPVPPTAAATVAAFGMTALTMDIDATGHSATATGHTELHEDVALHQLGTLHIDADVDGLDQAAVQPSVPGHLASPMMNAVIDHAALVWTDASLTGRLLAVAAAQQNTTPDLVRAELAMPVINLGLMVPDQPDAADQMTAFLTHPHRLTVTMNPPQKVSVGELAQAPVTARAHLLGVHIKAD